MSFQANKFSYQKINLIDIDNEKYIKKPIRQIEKQFFQNTKSFKFILQPTKIEDNFAYYKYLKKGNISNKEKIYFIQALKAIAKIHSITNIQNFNFLKTDLKNRTKIDYKKANIKQKYLEKLSEEIEKINKNNLRICHDDFIALNILITEEDSIKIIDWEDACLSFPESDVGRLLGDLFYEDINFEHRYYDFSWYEELCEVYLQERKKYEVNYDLKLGKKRIIIGELYNYLGPIKSCLKSSVKNEWFLANVDAFNKTVQDIL